MVGIARSVNQITQYAAISERPAATNFGIGVCQIGSALYQSDGVSWQRISSGPYRNLRNNLAFKRPERQYWDVTVSAWTTGESVKAGEVRSNDGHWYVAITSGVCGAFAPTGVLPKITSPYDRWNDGISGGSGSTGGVIWYYYGKPVTVPYNDGSIESVTVGFAATHDANVTQVFTTASGSYGTPTNYVQQVDTNSTKLWVPSGGGASISIASWVGWAIKTNAACIQALDTWGGVRGIRFANGIKGSSFAELSGFNYFEIWTDSDKIEINNNKADYGSRITIDGVNITPSVFLPSDALLSGMSATTDLSTLITISGEKKLRKIRFYGFTGLRSIRILPNAMLFSTIENNVPKALLLGDSYFAGSGGSPFGINCFSNQLEDLIGLQVTDISVGSTGIETTGSSGLWDDFKTRMISNYSGACIKNLTAFNYQSNAYDIVFVGVSINDSAASSTLVDSYKTLFANIRAQQPSALIVVLGNLWNTTNNNTRRTKVMTAISEFADQNLVLIDTMDSTKESGWIAGTGYSGAVSASGNSSLLISSDGTHPNNYGLDYYVKRVVTEMKSIL